MPVRKLAVCPPSIVENPALLERVLAKYPTATLWKGPRIMDEDVLIEFLKGHDAAIIGVNEPITDRVLTALPELKILSKMAAGCEAIDFEALKRHGVRFGYTFGVNKLAVAELTLAFMIDGLRMVGEQNVAMRGGERPGMRAGGLLTGRTVGLHGCGNIGKEVVRLLKPFGCKLLACDIKDYADFYRGNAIEAVSHDELLERSEVLSLHLPKTKSTRGLYSRQVLSRIRPDAVLVNTCRGEIVDEEALTDQLEAGKLRAACFDVFAIEPAICDRLLRHPRMLATPHIGAGAHEIRIAMTDSAIRGLEINELVDPAKFYEN
jgi:phosphoglycerate dehydrogenase-like enzyme